MAKKHFDEYFRKTQKTYYEMVDDIKELEQQCLTEMVASEKIETMKKTVEPLKNTYNLLAYVKYLMDMPINRKKQKRYVSQNKHILEDR